MGGLLNILLLLFCNEFNKLYNTDAQDYSIYHMMLFFFPFLLENAKIIPYMCDICSKLLVRKYLQFYTENVCFLSKPVNNVLFFIAVRAKCILS